MFCCSSSLCLLCTPNLSYDAFSCIAYCAIFIGLLVAPADLLHVAFSGPGIDPDKERAAPPLPTPIYFPQNDLSFTSHEEWRKSPPDLYSLYCSVPKPLDLKLEHLVALNFSCENDVSLEVFIPASGDELQHLPPKSAMAAMRRSLDSGIRKASMPDVLNDEKYPLILSNGRKAPDVETFFKFLRELSCDTEDGLRVVASRKPRHGHIAPHLNHFRKFWIQLEMMSRYWDTSLDQYIDAHQSAPSSHEKSAFKAFKRLSISKEVRSSSVQEQPQKLYRGRRTGTGSKMPEQFRIDAVFSFVEVVAWAFGCEVTHPRKLPQLEIGKLLIPVTQSAQVWRLPEDKADIRHGLLEGPVMGVQCRPDTAFANNQSAEVLDIAREMAGLVLLAQERARERRQNTVPGAGKWYTTKARWGGGPGGEFGEAEGNSDAQMETPRRHSAATSLPTQTKPNEEQIWKELKPGHSLWQPRTTYLSIGKDRGTQYDTVFMVSSLFHHLSILKLYVHNSYVDYTLAGTAPQQQHPDASWSSPKIHRTRWYDLLVPEDRVEALRGLWGVMSYIMRTDRTTTSQHQRKHSDVTNIFSSLSFRRRHHRSLLDPTRSQSVA